MSRLRLSAVSYLNTKPFIYGIYRSEFGNEVDLSLDIPSLCARKLTDGEVDLALCPVAAIADLPEAYLASDLCIGATGPVRTVCLYADTPLTDIQEIYLDYHSRTSVALVQILCREYWHIEPRFLPAKPGYESLLGGTTAGVVIGDRTIGLDARFAHVYDLGEAWTAWTGLPFVFAAWISTHPLDPALRRRFNGALQFGIDHLPELVKILPTFPNFNLEAYFRENISYVLDDAKWQGLNLFLTLLCGKEGYRLHRNVPAATV